jgi:hypothetical protein
MLVLSWHTTSDGADSRSTQKVSDMFGTLVICLPSEHVGGAVRLTHGEEEKRFDTAPQSGFNVTYIAW